MVEFTAQHNEQDEQKHQKNQKDAHQISFEPTPNPATMKFNLPFQVTEEGFEMTSAQETDRSPLASKIFGFPWTSSIFIGPQFITVTKQDWVDWSVLAEPLAGLILEHVNSGEAIVVAVAKTNEIEENDSAVVREIKKIINNEIRPMVALDGGDIVFRRYENQIVYLQLKGSCAGCPSSTATLKDGIQMRLKQAFPEIQDVQEA